MDTYTFAHIREYLYMHTITGAHIAPWSGNLSWAGQVYHALPDRVQEKTRYSEAPGKPRRLLEDHPPWLSMRWEAGSGQKVL